MAKKQTRGDWMMGVQSNINNEIIKATKEVVMEKQDKTIDLYEKVDARVLDLAELVQKKSSNKNPDYYKTQKEYKLWYVIRAYMGSGAESRAAEEMIEELFNTKRGV